MKFISKDVIEKERQNLLIRSQENILLSNKFVEYKEDSDHTKFDKACEVFKTVCKEIGKLVDIKDFHGGYDELLEIFDNKKLKTEEGKLLKEKLNLANNVCILEAKKIGLSSPDWFFKCWNIEK